MKSSDCVNVFDGVKVPLASKYRESVKLCDCEKSLDSVNKPVYVNWPVQVNSFESEKPIDFAKSFEFENFADSVK